MSTNSNIENIKWKAELLLFIGAMWGFCGAEFTRGFIEAQLKSMEPGVEFDVFSPPPTH